MTKLWPVYWVFRNGAETSAGTRISRPVSRSIIAQVVLARTTALPPASNDADRFYLVGEGVMVARGERLPRFATAFVSAGERDFELIAGDEGLEALVPQFPTHGTPG